MARKCSTCQHTKRAEIDRRLAAGEPGNQIAQDYGVNPSSLHRHRSKDDLNAAYFELRAQIDQIVSQARQEGSLQIALSGLNSVRHTLDSLSRLAGFDRPGAQVNVAVQTNVNFDPTQIVARVIQKFDHEPELKARIAQALLEVDDEQTA